jgi:hypothetical protein
MAVTVGEMTVEPAVEPEPRADDAVRGHEASDALSPQLRDHVECMMLVKAERYDRLRAD